MGLVLFASAGTVAYWQGWVFLAVYFGAASAITGYLIRKDPALLKRRLSGGPTAEKEPIQKVIMLAASVGFIALLVVPGLDYRFGWSSVPAPVAIAGDVLLAACFYAVFYVFKANTFTSATIEVSQDQKVISTGPYAYVRHPMYAAGLLLFLAIPIALGSYWGVLAVVPLVPVILWRLLGRRGAAF